MKSTYPLNVKTNLYIKDEIMIHPNEGFEVGLMNTSHNVKLFVNSAIEVFNNAETDYIIANLVLSNNCNHGEIIMNHKFWKKIGSPAKLKLHFDNNKVLLTKV
ncbi:MAG: hypothetical protein JXB50_01435 [Spirochaetes bacterium]|nr:hypothetical protein [Spirochaetota bacterium]